MLPEHLSNQYAGRFPEMVQDGRQVVKQYVQTFDSDTAKTFAEDLELWYLPSAGQPCPRREMDLVLYLLTHPFPELQGLCNTSRFEIPFDQGAMHESVLQLLCFQASGKNDESRLSTAGDQGRDIIVKQGMPEQFVLNSSQKLIASVA